VPIAWATASVLVESSLAILSSTSSSNSGVLTLRVLHQPAEGKEIPFRGGVDEVEQTFCGVDDFCEETAVGRCGELLFRFL
jgi:hypothetical protein